MVTSDKAFDQDGEALVVKAVHEAIRQSLGPHSRGNRRRERQRSLAGDEESSGAPPSVSDSGSICRVPRPRCMCVIR